MRLVYQLECKVHDFSDIKSAFSVNEGGDFRRVSYSKEFISKIQDVRSSKKVKKFRMVVKSE